MPISVIAAFMAGLGLGSLGGGHLADRVSRRTSLVLFGVAELAVATFGVWSSTLFSECSTNGSDNCAPPSAGVRNLARF